MNRISQGRIGHLLYRHLCWLMLLGVLCLGATAVQASPLAYLADRKLNTVSVVDLANYSTIASISLGTTPALPTEVVANRASGKVFVGQATGVVIIDAATQSVTGTVAVGSVRALVVSPSGTKVFALTAGSLAVIDARAQSVLATLAVDPSAVSLAIDKDGETVYAAHTGLAPGTNDVLGVAGLTIIDALANEVASVVKTGEFRPDHMAVNPADDKLYLISNSGPAPEKQTYRIFDPATRAITRVAFALPLDTPVVFGLSSLAFNQDGSRLILGGYTFGATAIPLIEIATATGMVSRVLNVPAGLADQHTALKLVTSFAGGRFLLGVFLSEHLHHYPVEPGRRAVFIDGSSGTVYGDLGFPGPGDGDLLMGDILGSLATTGASGKTPTSVTLHANTPLQQLVCSLRFGVQARFRGNAQNEKSKSDVLSPSLSFRAG